MRKYLIKNYKLLGILILSIFFSVAAINIDGAKTTKSKGNNTYEKLYICAMHPWEASDKPDDCPICGMEFSEVHGHSPGAPMPDESELFVSESNPMYIHEGAGKDPEDGSVLIPIVQSPFYETKEDNGKSMESEHEEHSQMQTEEGTLWTCGMHPDVISDKPGLCPICHMKLIPLKGATAQGGGTVIAIDPVTLQDIGVKTNAVKRMDLDRTIRSNGIVETAENREYIVNSKISGWVEKLYVARTGDYVQKGETLLEIYSPELVSAQEEFLLALENSETMMNSGIAHIDSSGRSLLESARKRLQLWDISDSQIEELMNSREINRTMVLTSPTSGFVMIKNVTEGSFVKSGSDLFHIADLSKIWIQTQIYEDEVGWINTGDEVQIKSSYNPGLMLKGKVNFIYPTVDPKSRTVDVRIEVNNQDYTLKPGMYVDAYIQSPAVENSVAVLKSSVIRSGERDIVFVDKGEGKFEPRELHLGLETDDYYQVLHNLNEGEQVVVSGQFLLDSEANLQGAIQKRLEVMRKISGNETMTDEDMKMDGQQHNH